MGDSIWWRRRWHTSGGKKRAVDGAILTDGIRAVAEVRRQPSRPDGEPEWHWFTRARVPARRTADEGLFYATEFFARKACEDYVKAELVRAKSEARARRFEEKWVAKGWTDLPLEDVLALQREFFGRREQFDCVLREARRARGMYVPSWATILKAVPARWGGRCAACGSPYPLNVHHIRERVQGGNDASSNLITLCEGCHCGIPSFRDPEREFWQWLNRKRSLHGLQEVQPA